MVKEHPIFNTQQPISKGRKLKVKRVSLKEIGPMGLIRLRRAGLRRDKVGIMCLGYQPRKSDI
jgi:hypothetical protein